jgi:hypothetical protein
MSRNVVSAYNTAANIRVRLTVARSIYSQYHDTGNGAASAPNGLRFVLLGHTYVKEGVEK